MGCREKKRKHNEVVVIDDEEVTESQPKSPNTDYEQRKLRFPLPVRKIINVIFPPKKVYTILLRINNLVKTLSEGHFK